MRHSISARLCFVENLNRVATAAIYREWELKVKGLEMVVSLVSSEGKNGARSKKPCLSPYLLLEFLDIDGQCRPFAFLKPKETIEFILTQDLCVFIDHVPGEGVGTLGETLRHEFSE